MHEKALHMSLLPSDTGKWKPLPWTLNLTSLLWSDFLSFSKAPPMPGWALVPGAIPVGTLTPDQTLWPSVPVSLLWGTLTLCCVVGLTKHSAKLWTHAYGILLELSAGSYFQKGNLIRSVPQAIKVFCANPWTIATPPPQAFLSMEFSRQDIGVSCYALLQAIFLTQGSNPGLLCLLHWQVGSLPLTPSGKPSHETGQLERFWHAYLRWLKLFIVKGPTKIFFQSPVDTKAISYLTV